MTSAIERQRRAVALELGIGVLAEHHDRDVGLLVKLPSGDSSRAAAGRAHRALDALPQIEVAPGKSALVRPVPCQLIVQPPVAREMLSAPSPATSTRAGLRAAARPRSSAARAIRAPPARATARCSGRAEQLRTGRQAGRVDGLPRSNSPSAQSSRAGCASPRRRSAPSESRPLSHLREQVGVESASSCPAPCTCRCPALSACGQLRWCSPATWPCAFQSLTMKPSKPMRSFSTSVSSARVAGHLLAAASSRTEPSRSARRSRSPGRRARRGCRAAAARLICASPWSSPFVGAAVGEEVLGRGDAPCRARGSSAVPGGPAARATIAPDVRGDELRDPPNSPRRRGPSDRPAARATVGAKVHSMPGDAHFAAPSPRRSARSAPGRASRRGRCCAGTASRR